MAQANSTSPESTDKWPKQFAAGEEVPEELRENDAVQLIETDYEPEPDGSGLVATVTAYHEDYSPRAWIEVFGVERDELDDSFKYQINESIMNTAHHSEESIVRLSWFTDDDIDVLGEGEEITAADIQSTLKVLESLREMFRADDMAGEKQTPNEALCLIDNFSGELIGKMEDEEC